MGPKRTSDTPQPVRYKTVTPTTRPLTSGTFEPYRISRIAITGARTHPAPLVESAAMASISAPVPTYKPVLEPSIISRGLLSAEQLETVIYAGEQHRSNFTVTTMTKDGPVTAIYRKGYYIADGTGTGKGRIAASIIRDSFNQGRDRAIWLTMNELLLKDAVRDWSDILGSPDVFQKWSSTKLSDELTIPANTILFGTYAMLRARKREKVKPAAEIAPAEPPGPKIETVMRRRVDQLIDALPPTFDGVIVLDESGELENADPSVTEHGNSREASLQGQTALELQARLPNARIVYISATGTSRIDGLAYASRLHLWGDSTGFASQTQFMKAMQKGGTAALEVVCRELKALGRICARTLSYEGVQYERITHELDETQVEMFNAYTRTWRMIEHGFTAELLAQGAVEQPPDGRLDVKGIPGSPLPKLRGHLQSAKQRFFAQALMSMTWPSTRAYIERELKNDKAVVIQLTHTNEAHLKRALEAMEETSSLEDLELSHREFLTRFIHQHYPVGTFRGHWKDKIWQVESVIKPDGTVIVDPKAEERREQLIASIEELVFPDTILELIHDAFGELVAEVTGRKCKLVRQVQPDETTARVLVKRGSRENAREIEAFLNGKKRVLVFTEGCGGMGQSFHSDIRFKNHRPRIHIFLEMSWSASKALQGCGRTHRTGQICPPTYVFVSSTVPGQKRFSSTPARRIAALGALTRGQREAADNGLFRAQDNLETPYAERALRTLLADINKGSVDGIDSATLFAQTGIDASNCKVESDDTPVWPPKHNRGIRMPVFLNRMLSSDIAVDGGFQELLMSAFLDRLDTIIDEEIAAGTYDIGVETFKPVSLTVAQRETLHADPLTGATADLLTLAVQEYPWGWTSFEEALTKRAFYEESSGKSNAQFMLDPKGEIALHIPVVHEIATLNPTVRLICPSGERSRFLRNGKKYIAITDPEEARKRWEDALGSIDMDARTMYAVTGTLLAVWTRLPETLPSVYRMQTDDGERLLARIIRPAEIAGVCQAFGLTAPAEPVAA
jgi:hypothetical protein